MINKKVKILIEIGTDIYGQHIDFALFDDRDMRIRYTQIKDKSKSLNAETDMLTEFELTSAKNFINTNIETGYQKSEITLLIKENQNKDRFGQYMEAAAAYNKTVYSDNVYLVKEVDALTYNMYLAKL